MKKNKECEWVREQINAFLDNELTPNKAVLMTRHLESCVPCHHEYEQMQTVRTTLRGLPSLASAASQSAKERAFARLEQAAPVTPIPLTDPRHPFRQRFMQWRDLRPLAATFAVAAMAGITFLLWPSSEVEAPSSAPLPVQTVAAPTSAEWDNLFHRHDAQLVSFSSDDLALGRDVTAEAHASLMKQADEELTGSL